jgi:hypothetical protein
MVMVKWLREAWDKKPHAVLEKRGVLVLVAFKGYFTQRKQKLQLLIETQV